MDLGLFVAKCWLVLMFVHGSGLLVENTCSDSLFVHHKGHSVEKLLWGPVFVHENGTFVEAADGFVAFRSEMQVGTYVCPRI